MGTKGGTWREKIWYGQRMETKLFAVFLLLLVLPIGVLSYVSANRYSASIEQHTVDYMTQLSANMMSKLDDYITDLEKISIIPYYLEEIKNGLKASNQFNDEADAAAGEETGTGAKTGAHGGSSAGIHEGTDADARAGAADPGGYPGGAGAPRGVLSRDALKRLEIQMRLNNSIHFLNNVKIGTNTVYLFDQYGHPYMAMKSNSMRTDLAEAYARWKAQASAARGLPVLVSTQSVTSPPADTRYVFTVVRDILDAYRPIGMIAIDANIKVIENIVRDLDDTTGGTTFIFDQEGRVIFDSGKRHLGALMPDHVLFVRASGPSGSFYADWEGREVLAIYDTSEKTGWKMVIAIPRGELIGNAMRIRTFTTAAAIVIVGLALVISLILIYALTRPLRSLVHLMKEVQGGNMDVTFPVRGPDEIGLVGSAFNRMIARIKSLIEDIYRAEQRKKEAQLEALQNQINPHFIYNTLETIRMTAVVNDDGEVANMAHLLGKLLRYGISAATETVPLRKEFEHLRMYVRLLNYRYGDRFTLRLPETGVDPDMPVMKLLFQPIVENAVYHGLRDDRRMEIAIDYRRSGREHQFTIRDNGTGMTPEELGRLREKLERPPEGETRGLGLRNVHERLKLRYGEAYGLRLDSERDAGTVVTVRWPA